MTIHTKTSIYAISPKSCMINHTNRTGFMSEDILFTSDDFCARPITTHVCAQQPTPSRLQTDYTLTGTLHSREPGGMLDATAK